MNQVMCLILFLRRGDGISPQIKWHERQNLSFFAPTTRRHLPVHNAQAGDIAHRAIGRAMNAAIDYGCRMTWDES